MGYSRAVLISGGTGFVGRRLLPELLRQLLRQGHAVRALVRPGSEDKVCGQCAVTTGDVLNSQTFSMAMAPADTFIHLDRLWQLLVDGPVAGLYTTRVCTCDGGFCGRSGLGTIQQMVAALVWTIEHPTDGVRIVDVPGIRARKQDVEKGHQLCSRIVLSLNVPQGYASASKTLPTHHLAGAHKRGAPCASLRP